MTEKTMTGRVAVVTGGGSGLGREMALRFARDGAAVVVADQNIDTAQKVAGEIAKAGGRGLAIKVDVREQREVEAMVIPLSRNSAGCTSWSTRRALASRPRS